MPTARAACPVAIARLAVELGPAGELPTEFRLFVAGVNETENGSFVFDAAAAAAVMEAHEAWGVDLMIDLEHQSLEPKAAADPTARDARGWCRLELRSDGSLWAVGVTWTDDGATRLRTKRQRYVSPAFGFDPESKRITNIINVAITSIPATHHTPALVAARAARDVGALSSGPAFADVRMAVEAALRERFPRPAQDGCPTGPWVVDLFDATVVFELDGSLFELPYAFDGGTATLGPSVVEVQRSYTPVDAAPIATQRMQRTEQLSAGGQAMDPKLIADALDALIAGDAAKCQEILKGLVAAAAGAAPAATPADDGAGDPGAGGELAAAPPPEDDKDKDKDKMLAAAARIALSITGIADPSAAVAELDRRSQVALDLERREGQLAADRAKMDGVERRRLVGELVRLGVEIPATAWSDDKGTVPCERLSNEPIADLRARVQKLSAARGGRQPVARPPAAAAGAAAGDDQEIATEHGVVTLSARELRTCEELGADPKVYAANKAIQAAARA